MLSFFLALALIVLMMLAYVSVVSVVVDPSSIVWRTRGRLRVSALVRREVAGLDREYVSLVEEHRRTP